MCKLAQKILIVSDTHGKLDYFKKALAAEKPVDRVIHAGDIYDQAGEFTKLCDCPVDIVRGNNDFDFSLPSDENIFIGNAKVFLTHGHRYSVSWGLRKLEEEAEKRKAGMVIYGHTHYPDVTYKGNKIFLNPGSISSPRQPGRKHTYAVIAVSDEGEITFELKSLEGAANPAEIS